MSEKAGSNKMRSRSPQPLSSPHQQNQQKWMFEDEDDFDDPFSSSDEKKKHRMMMTMMKPQAYIQEGNKKDSTPKTSLTNSTLTPTSSEWEIHPPRGDENSLGLSSVGGAPKPPVASIRVESPLPVMPRKNMDTSLNKKQTPASMMAAAMASAKKSGGGALANSNEDVDGDPSPLKSEMLESFLKKAGQDEKLASEMALAFEAFLLQQNQHKDEVSDLGQTATTPHAVSEVDYNNNSDAVSELAFTSVSDWAPPPPPQTRSRPPTMVVQHPPPPPTYGQYPPPSPHHPPHYYPHGVPPSPHAPPHMQAPPTPSGMQKTTNSQGSDFEEDDEGISFSEGDSVSFEQFYSSRNRGPPHPYQAPPHHPHHPHYPPPHPHSYGGYPPPPSSPAHFSSGPSPQGRYDDYDYATGAGPSPRHSTGSYYNDYDYGHAPPPLYSPSPSPVPTQADFMRHSAGGSGNYPQYSEPPPTPSRSKRGASTRSYGSNNSPLHAPYPNNPSNIPSVGYPMTPQTPSNVPSGRRSAPPPGAGIPQPHVMMHNMARSLRSAPAAPQNASVSSNQWGTTNSTSSATPTERPIEEQLKSLSLTERNCVQQLKQKWESRKSRTPLSMDLYLRMARNSPGRPFNYQQAWKVMKKMDAKYFQLGITQMEDQIKTKTVFPAPGLQDKQGHDVFYMRPSRFIPKTMSTNSLMDSLVYVMNCLMEKERNCKNGIGLVANMTDWKMINFSVSYWHRFMMTLQGRRSPCRIQLFLLVNPPAWFNKIWLIMKPMLTDDFRKKVHMISFHAMKYHMKKGYEQFLPDDIHSGRSDTDALIKGFVEERKRVESSRIMSA